MAKKPSDTVGLTLRMKEALRTELERSARDRGVSLNSEVIHRLERSFDQGQRIEDVFGSEEVFGLARALASVMDTAGRKSGFLYGRATTTRGWLDDPYCYDQALQAAVHVLNALRPPGVIEKPSMGGEAVGDPPVNIEGLLQQMRASIGVGVAALMLGENADAARASDETRSKLGRLADRLSKEDDR